MFVISKPELLIENERTLLRASTTCEGYPEDHLWFSASSDYADYLSAERADAFLAAVLPYAMMKQHDIRIDGPVSERLYYTVTEYLVPALHRKFPSLRDVKIECDLDNSTLPNAGAVGTGISCGVDSLFTVARHTSDQCPPGFRLTHLTFHDSGSHGLSSDRSEQLARERLALAREFASEMGLPLVVIDTNLSTLVKAAGVDYKQMHTYLNAGCVLALQRLFRAYYYSSTFPVHAFEFTFDTTSHYDSYSLPLLSTDQLDIFSAGTPHSRVEKTRYLVDYEPSHRFLNVCVTAGENCSCCPKCLRTLVTLDALGALETYRDVFDLDIYARHRAKHVVEAMRGDDEWSSDIRALMNETGFTPSTTQYLYYSLRQAVATSSAGRKLHSMLGAARS